MSNGKHYFIEETHDGKYIAKPKGEEASGPFFSTQAEAIAYAKQQNPNDHPDVERVRNREGGKRDQWRGVE